MHMFRHRRRPDQIRPASAVIPPAVRKVNAEVSEQLLVHGVLMGIAGGIRIQGMQRVTVAAVSPQDQADTVSASLPAYYVSFAGTVG